MRFGVQGCEVTVLSKIEKTFAIGPKVFIFGSASFEDGSAVFSSCEKLFLKHVGLCLVLPWGRTGPSVFAARWANSRDLGFMLIREYQTKDISDAMRAISPIKGAVMFGTDATSRALHLTLIEMNTPVWIR